MFITHNHFITKRIKDILENELCNPVRNEVAAWNRTPEKNIFVFENIWKTFFQIKRVLTLPCDAEDTLEHRNVQVFTKIIENLASIIRPWRLKMSMPRENAILSLKTAITTAKIKLFLSFCNTFCCFVFSFAPFRAPRSKPIREKQQATFGLFNKE